METLLDGCFYHRRRQAVSVSGKKLADVENLYIEPSACASFTGPGHVLSAEGYLIKNNLKDKLRSATHILWATGGSMVPKEEMEAYYKMGKNRR